ncbi:Pirin-related protein [Corynebacterium mustelae]|uniref:Pirin-related protein n=1 Tax=Corynebacterium mustelae TaxID=571915 RepID=A0A0G3GWX8_9CORY|nr:pirin family protein [Corynebacterium mustelae]AKK05060.1 Pirin-related protein [Corynebacterium mustelae]
MPILTPREVPLGGLRALNVRRTLPHRNRTTVGPWVFIDHYGPTTKAMDVAPHPHCGLSTVSWLFEGSICHNDSAGFHELIEPGQLVMMTAGNGISHTEESQPGNLHGAQLWMVHPLSERDIVNPQPRLQRYHPPTEKIGDATIKVFMGHIEGCTPANVVAPLDAIGAEISIPAGGSVTIPLRNDCEYAVLANDSSFTVNTDRMNDGDLWYCDAESEPQGSRTMHISADSGPAHLLLLGGLPLGEEIVMLWNFIGRDHDEVLQMRADWEDPSRRHARYGTVTGYGGTTEFIPAPLPPTSRLKPRKNPPVDA